MKFRLIFRAAGRPAVHALWLLALLALTSCATFLGVNREAGLRYLRQARNQAAAGQMEAAIHSYRLATINDRRLDEAYYELARLLLKRNRVTDRVEAADLLERAIRFAPDSVKYRMALARLNLRRRLLLSAKNGFKKVLKLDSTNAEAHYFLGFLFEKDFLHFQHMVDGDSGEAQISFGQFAEENFSKAVQHYQRAFQLNPNDPGPVYRLAFLYYEKSNWPAMIRVMRQAVKAAPDSARAHLYLALAYHRAHRYAHAWREFQLALAHMDSSERQFYFSHELLRPEFVDSVVAGDPPGSAPDSVYWRKRDPLYLTDYNERLMEHWARIAYADLRFSDPVRGIRGWQTDRGRVYIRYGPPLKQVRTRPWIGVISSGGRGPLVTSKETWSYPDFDLVFEDRFLTENFEFKWGYTPYDDYLDIYKRLVREVPEFYLPDWGGGVFRVPLQIAAFRGADGKPVLYVWAGVPVENVTRVVHFADRRATTVLEHGVFLFDGRYRPVVRQKRRVYLEAHLNPRLSPNAFVTLDSLHVPPGGYHLSVEFLDPKGKHVGLRRDSLAVTGFPRDSLALSDLLLAQEIRLQTDLARLNRSRILVYPNFTGEFRPGQDLHLYYEIYNLTLDGSGMSRFRTTLVVQPEHGKNMLQALLSWLPGLSASLPRVAVTSTLEGTRRQENQYRILQLGRYEPGEYRLIVRVEDLNSGQVAERWIPFRIRK